jgi:G3E family GTPase
VSEEELRGTWEAVLAINPEVRVTTSQRCRVPVEELLNIRAFDASRNEALLRSRQEQGSGASSGDIEITRGTFHIETDETGKILSRKTKKRSTGTAAALDRLSDDAKKGSTSTSSSSKSGAVSTLSLTSSEPLDLNLFNVWMAQLLQEKGNDLYRFKGAKDRHDITITVYAAC